MDVLDKQILGYIMRDGELATSGLVERIFEVSDKYDRHKKICKIRYRLESLVGNGLLSRNKNKKYSLSDCVICDESTIVLHTASGDIHLESGPAVMFEHPDGDFRLILLNQP